MRESDLIADLLAKPGPSSETVDAGRRRLRRESTTWRPGRGLVFGGMGGFAALVAGGVAAAVLMTGGGEQVLVEPDNAASALQAAAERAESAPWGAGKYWYTKYRYTMAQSHDGPISMGGTAATWTTRDGRRWYKPISPPGKIMKPRGRTSFSLCDKEVTYRQIQDLPTEPDALRSEVRRMMLNNDDGPVPPDHQDRFLTSCMIGLISTQPAPPKVRAAAFRSLAGLPQTEKLGTRRDSTGREGTALAITNGKSRDELIIDIATSTVLETENVQIGRDQKMVQTSTIYELGWTDTPPS